MRTLCERPALRPPDGVGKSYLCSCLLVKLPGKRFKTLSLAHSSLTGSDLLRALCHQLGIGAHMRRSDNVGKLQGAFAQLGQRWPLLVLEEAQNLSALALEEIRLLACAQQATWPPFSLLLLGDESVLARLQMGVNRALLSRLSFSLKLERLNPAQAREYIAGRLRECAIQNAVFEPPALDLLLQAATDCTARSTTSPGPPYRRHSIPRARSCAALTSRAPAPPTLDYRALDA